ncbi:MAG: hypothetical protein RDU24_07085 [Humidesulfovibrio sp.]|uniref:hypothetical protein n=1 Tax=Humidesulfovibrio sp. TaxID=2910988 RepID=UPI0027F4ACC6|nr:hypothetical protein [Humidesulfovibrio sp.]MDQ7835130.1 hypothetical protein [Humidesulfovibrio sp.]
MDIQTLSSVMANQATQAVGLQVPQNTQPTNADNPGKASGGDSIEISEAARAKAASAPAASSEGSSAAQSTADTLARRIAKLQKDLQREQGSDQTPEEKASHLANLRGQIRQLQNQQKGSSGDAATSFKIRHI